MSKSIKDYKDAMDSIRISESFYKRTETLLNDLPDDDTENKPFRISKKITAGVMAAAACLVCVIGIRLVLDQREDNIGSAAETSLTKITTQITTDIVSVPELIDIPEAIEEKLDEAVGADPISAAGEADTETAQATASDEAVPGIAEDSISIDGENGIAPLALDENDPKPIIAVPTEESTGIDDTAADVSTISDIKDIAPENVTVEITPYFDMGNIHSGEDPITKGGEEFPDILEEIKDITENSEQKANSEFISIFMVKISDKTSGNTLYSIYVTDSSAVVITKHTSPQERTTYSLSDSSYDALKRSLFLLFGEESDYTLFEDLIGGR